MGRPTTPDELRRRGVRRVRSVGMREVSLLIERAVNRTLLERTQHVSKRELAELVRAAQDEFSTQLKGLNDLSDSRELVERHRREWRASLEELRKEVSRRRGFVEQQERGLAPEDRARSQALLAELQAELEPLDASPATRAAVAARLAQLLNGRLVDERAELLRRHDQELALLERRLAKLVGGLEETERSLERAARARAADLGLSSIYREVQGLDPGERERELKRVLMARIFEANLELRATLTPASPEPPEAAAPATP